MIQNLSKSMSIIKKIIFLSIFIPIISVSNSFAEDLKKVGKFKDWDVMVMTNFRKSMFCSINSCFKHQKIIKETQDYLSPLDLVKKFLTK